MFILKNAFISITRNKGRNVLIGIIILVIACACTVTLAINNTASDLIGSYESAYDKELTLAFDRQSLMKNFDYSNSDGMKNARNAFNNIQSYTIDDVISFAESDHIESYYYTYGISLNGNNIDRAENENGNSFGYPGGGRNSSPSLDFTLTGYSSIESMSEFIDGTYTMNEITDNAWDIAFGGNYVFINEELATYNELSLNDKIKLEDENGNVYEFEIIGIFKDNDTSEATPMSMFSNSANTIVTNATALTTIAEGNENINGQVNPTFIIDSYKNAEAIQEEFYEKGLDESYIVQTNEETANAGLTSIQNVKSFATTFLVITLIIGGVVLFILNMINIRERKYEIGVLRTIGISKIKLTIQFISELLIVSLVALMIGAGLGATMSKSVSNSLLSSEIENTENEAKDMENNFGGPGGMGGGNRFGNLSRTPTVQAYDSIDAVVNVTVILELLAIGVVLVLISSSAAMVSIQRFSPLTILKERS